MRSAINLGLNNSLGGPFGFSYYGYAWVVQSLVKTSSNFANSVKVLGATTGTGELTATATNSASISALGRTIQVVVPYRQIADQTTLNIQAAEELANRAYQTKLTFMFYQDSIVANGNGFVGQLIDVGQMVLVQSLPLGLFGFFQVQQLTMTQLAPGNSNGTTKYVAQCGDYQGDLVNRIKQLQQLAQPINVAAGIVPNGATTVVFHTTDSKTVTTVNNQIISIV